MEHMFSFVQESNVNEFVSLTEKVNSISDKLELFVDKWKEFGSFYQSIMLLSIDVLRNVSSENSEKIFIDFSNHYTVAMSRELRIPENEARSLFIYLLGIILHSMLTPGFMPYERQIDVLKGMLEKVLPIEEGGAVLSDRKDMIGSFINNARTANS